MSLGCSQNILKQVGVRSLSSGSHSHLILISRASHSHPTLLSLSTCVSSKVVQDFVHQPYLCVATSLLVCSILVGLPPLPSSAVQSSTSSEAQPHFAVDEFLMQIEAAHRAARGELDDAAARRKRLSEEFRLAKHASQESVASLERAIQEVPLMEQRKHCDEGHLEWLEGTLKHCEKGKARQVFQDAVMAAFCAAIAPLRKACMMQKKRVQEVTLFLQNAREECDRGRRERDDFEGKVAQLQEELRQVDDDAKAAQGNVDQLMSEMSQVRMAAQMQQQIADLEATSERAMGNARALASQRDKACARYDEFKIWTDDMRSFFDGHSVQDSNAIHAGMQAVMPRGDPLPTIVRALMTDSSNSLDMANSTIVSVRDLVQKQLRVASRSLREEVAAKQVAYAEAERRQAEVAQQLSQRREALITAIPHIDWAQRQPRCGAPQTHSIA
jgi:hypothetical protein